MKNLILVTGSEGLVGSRFVEISDRKNFLHYPKQVELDITKPEELKAVINSYNFSAIIHFAAYTDVSEAEKQRGDKNGDCWIINVEGTRNLANAIKPFKEKIHYIQISTDLVFSGSRETPGPYAEKDLPERNSSKVTWYGFSKGEAERIVRNVLGDSATIVRIIYPVRADFESKLDYIRKPLKLFDEGKLYPLFTDQQISISFIDEVCNAIDKIIINNIKGTFHVGSTDLTTPFELISYVLKEVRGVDQGIKSTSLDEFLAKTHLNPIRYPKYGGLKVNQTEKRLNLNFSSWCQIVDKLIKQGLGKAKETS